MTPYEMMKKIDGVAAVNLAEPSPGDLERVVNAYTKCRAEYDRLREAIKEITREAHNAHQNGCNLTYKSICEWSNESLGEPSLADLKANRTGQ